MTYPLSSASFAGHSAPVWYFWHCFPGNPSLTWCDWQGYQAAVGLARLCSLASLLPLCLKSSCFSQNSAFHTFCGSGDAQLQPVCTICYVVTCHIQPFLTSCLGSSHSCCIQVNVWEETQLVMPSYPWDSFQRRGLILLPCAQRVISLFRSSDTYIHRKHITVSSLRQNYLFNWSGNFKNLILWLRFNLRKHWLNSTLYICCFCIRNGYLYCTI